MIPENKLKILKTIEYEFLYGNNEEVIDVDHGNKKEADKLIKKKQEDLLAINKVHRYGNQEEGEIHRQEYPYWGKWLR